MSYKDKVVLITGGAKGIGYEIANTYAREYCKVIVFDVDDINGNNVSKEFKYEDLHYDFYKVDIGNTEELINALDAVYEKYNRVDILINNGAIWSSEDLKSQSIEQWCRIIDVNLKSAYITSKIFIERYQNDYGRIINIASTRAFMSEPGTEAYSASKGGLLALTHALAISSSKKGLTVNAISPGWIHTGDYDELCDNDHSQHPSNRVGKPEDIARACMFLSHEDNDFLNGENLVIDGGMTKKMIYE